MKKTTCIRSKDAIKALTDLEFIVVSLDHIGASSPSKEDRKKYLYDFVVKSNIARRLAAMRGVMDVAVDAASSPKERELLQRRFEKMKTWSPPR
jgi:hypothetical protein